MGWIITLGVLTLLAILPIGVSAIYNEDGPLVRVILGPIRFLVFPRPKKLGKDKKKEPKKKEKKKDNKAEETELPQPPPPEMPKKAPKPAKKGGSVTDFLPLVKTALEMLGCFRRKLRVKVLELKVIMAGGDPCDLAINYGRAWAAVGNLWPQLERLFVIKKRDVEVECDFTADQMLVIARLDLTITLGRVISTAVIYGVRILIQFLKIQKKRKGGAVK